MVTTIREVKAEKKRSERQFEPDRTVVSATMIAVNGSVEVTGVAGEVWVEVGTDTAAGDTQVMRVLNIRVQPLAGLPVLVGPSPKSENVWQVVDIDIEKLVELPNYPSFPGNPYIGAHHQTHEWPDFSPGTDVVQIYPRAIVPLRTYAYSLLTVSVAPLRSYKYKGETKSFAGINGYDLSSHKPASGLARYVLVYLDKVTNTVSSVAGDTNTDSAAITLTSPDSPANGIDSAYVRIDGSQTSFNELDFVDARDIINDDSSSWQNTTEQLAILEAEYDLNMTIHAVQG